MPQYIADRPRARRRPDGLGAARPCPQGGRGPRWRRPSLRDRTRASTPRMPRPHVHLGSPAQGHGRHRVPPSRRLSCSAEARLHYSDDCRAGSKRDLAAAKAAPAIRRSPDGAKRRHPPCLRRLPWAGRPWPVPVSLSRRSMPGLSRRFGSRRCGHALTEPLMPWLRGPWRPIVHRRFQRRGSHTSAPRSEHRGELHFGRG